MNGPAGWRPGNPSRRHRATIPSGTWRASGSRRTASRRRGPETGSAHGTPSTQPYTDDAGVKALPFAGFASLWRNSGGRASNRWDRDDLHDYGWTMTFPALIVRVLVASPGDTAAERAAVEQAIHDWNAARAVGAEVVLMPVRWETHAVPELGGDAQAVVNNQLGDVCDIVVAVFNARLGTATPRAISGSVEEIERARQAGRPVHVWFSTAPLPRDVDVEQLSELQAFKKNLKGLYGEYADVPDLAFQVRQALERDVHRLAESEKVDLVEVFERGLADEAASAPSPKARLRADSRRGKQGEVTVSITNSGTAPAEDLSVSFISASGQELHAIGPQHGTLLDGATQTWHIWLSLADASPERVRMTWLEGGDTRSLEQIIST